MPEVTEAAAPVQSVGSEVGEQRTARIARTERRRPEEADVPRSVETRAVPVTGSRKEYTVPVGRFKQSTVDSAAIVVRYPSPGTLCP